GLLAPRVDGRLDGVGLGVTRGADQHRHAPTFGGAGVAVFAFGGVGVPRVAGVGGGGGGLVTRGDRDGGVLRAVPAASGGDERYDREEEHRSPVFMRLHRTFPSLLLEPRRLRLGRLAPAAGAGVWAPPSGPGRR